MPGKLESHKHLWSLAEGITLCRRLQRRLEPAGFAVAITGSVLFKGKSYKDLDLVIYPLSTAHVEMHKLYEALRLVGLTPWVPADTVHARWRRLGSKDTKHVEVWRFGVRRVDLFILK